MPPEDKPTTEVVRPTHTLSFVYHDGQVYDLLDPKTMTPGQCEKALNLLLTATITGGNIQSYTGQPMGIRVKKPFGDPSGNYHVSNPGIPQPYPYAYFMGKLSALLPKTIPPRPFQYSETLRASQTDLALAINGFVRDYAEAGKSTVLKEISEIAHQVPTPMR